MAFEHSVPNKFFILSRLSKQVTEEVDIHADQPQRALPERPIICQGVRKVPGIEDLHLIKHAHGVFIYEVRKNKVYNIQLSKLCKSADKQHQKSQPLVHQQQADQVQKQQETGQKDRDDEDRLPVSEAPTASTYETISDGWSFSDLLHIHRDQLTQSYSLLVVEGRQPVFRVNKYDITDIINAFKLMRLEESERKR